MPVQLQRRDRPAGSWDPNKKARSITQNYIVLAQINEIPKGLIGAYHHLSMLGLEHLIARQEILARVKGSEA